MSSVRKRSLPTLPKAKLDVEYADGVVIYLGGVNDYKKVERVVASLG